MGLLDGIKNLFNKPSNNTRAKMLDGYYPVFTQYGSSIYKSDVVQQAISCIATEMSKLQPRHIKSTDKSMTTPVSQLNKLFRKPNERMTTRDLIEKSVWSLFLNYNSFIYPMYELAIDSSGSVTKKYKALYPIQPTQVEFLQDAANELYVTLTFASNDKFTLKYSDLIHIRYRYSVNEFMGGNEAGQPDTDTIKETVQINHDLLNSVSAAVKYSMKITGILKVNTMLDGESATNERERFENQIEDGKSGILIADLKGDYTNIKPDAKLVDTETLKFLDSKILRNYGVSLPILTGDFTSAQYQAFYEKTLEPLIIAYGQAFTGTLLTSDEQNFGNEIIFYANKMLFASPEQKTAVADILGNRGAMTNNMLLDLFGYPPYEGGDVRMQSLNFIDVTQAIQYQMNQAKKGATEQ